MFNDNLNNVAINKIEGNDDKSSGLSIYIPTRRIMMAKVILKDKKRSSINVGIGMIMIWITGWYILDPIIAILVALFILKEATEILIHAYKPLTDSSLSKEEVETIRKIIGDNMGECMNFHKLRTRKGGSHRYIDFHLEVTKEMSVQESHDICDHIEKKIKDQIRNAEVTIHVEPKDCQT